MIHLKSLWHHCKLILILPFFMVTLIPKGMMLSENPSSLSNVLIICPSTIQSTLTRKDSSITLNNHAHHDMPQHHGMSQHHKDTPQHHDISQHQSDTPNDTSCPDSIANSAYIDTKGTDIVVSIENVKPSLLAHYQAQHLITIHPTQYPRGPPSFVA